MTEQTNPVSQILRNSSLSAQAATRPNVTNPSQSQTATPLTCSERATVAYVIQQLSTDGSETECYCGNPLCTPENPECGGSRQAHLINELRKLVVPEVTTRHPARLNSATEKIYFEAAQALAEEKPGINGGYSTLSYILSPDLKYPTPPSHEEAEIVGTLLQWLGTNCGGHFIKECDRRIEQERLERSRWLVDYLPPYPTSRDEFCNRHAERLVMAEFPADHESAQRVVRRVAVAFEQLMCVLAVRAGVMSAKQGGERMGRDAEAFMRMYDNAMQQVKTMVADSSEKPKAEVAA